MIMHILKIYKRFDQILYNDYKIWFGVMGGFKGWVRGQQCTGVNLITVREHNSICLYCIVLINDKLCMFLKISFSPLLLMYMIQGIFCLMIHNSILM